MSDSDASQELVLDVDGLTKQYRSLVAVDDLSLTIDPGEFVGLIGPNGAGKSTLMGCIAGLLAADDGSITVGGVDVAAEPVDARRHIGFVPQDLDLYDYLTGEEFLRFVADIRGVDQERADEAVEDYLQLLELDDARDRVLKEYSGGMARKIGVAGALIGSPELLLMDEAFVGLDPESAHAIRGRLRDFCENGGAIVLSSHVLEMLQSICSRIVVLVDGRLERDLTENEMRELFEGGEFDDLTDIYLETTGKRPERR
jgi:ABC-2 type transport system ATP-binding protein